MLGTFKIQFYWCRNSYCRYLCCQTYGVLRFHILGTGVLKTILNNSRVNHLGVCKFRFRAAFRFAHNYFQLRHGFYSISVYFLLKNNNFTYVINKLLNKTRERYWCEVIISSMDEERSLNIFCRISSLSPTQLQY